MNQMIALVLGFIFGFAFGMDHLLSGDFKTYPFAPDDQEIGFLEKAFRYKDRPKRVANNLLLKVFVVVDFSLYQRWLEIEGGDVDKTIANFRYFYAHLVDGINEKYSSIDTGSFRYNVALTGCYIAQTLNDSSFTESEDVKTEDPAVLNFTKVLKKLEAWITERADVIKNYGVVSVSTTYKDISATALATVGTACTSSGISVLQSGSLYPTINIAAHEIGHNLGSKHDSDGNDCYAMQYYLMTPKIRRVSVSNYQTFSRCSRNYFENYITSLNSTVKENCFRVEATQMDEEVKKYLAELPGQRFTLDQYCQHQFGSNSYYCSTGAKAVLNVCQVIACFNPQDNLCYSSPDGKGPEGTPCGNKSWCLNTRCVYDDRAPVKEEYCMLGETKYFTMYNNKKYFCSDLLKEPGLCYYDTFEQNCCETCPILAAKESADCKYGDHLQSMMYGNKSITCEDSVAVNGYCYIDTFREMCCKTCERISTKFNNTSDCMFGDHLQSVMYGTKSLTCEDSLAVNGYCYIDTFREICCKTCKRVSTKFNNTSDCKFGDRLQSVMYGTKSLTCEDSLAVNGYCYIDTFREICCKTCKLFLTKFNSTTCPYGDRIYSITYGSETLTCPDFIKYPFLCYDSGRKSKCCKSCVELKSGVLGCEYGDRSTQCQSYVEKYGSNICKRNSEIKSQCCKTCASV